MKRLIIVPRWAGGPQGDFYPWLRQELSRLPVAPFGEVCSPDMPAPGTPVIDAWVGHLRQVAGADPAQLADTVVLGHSVGCQAALRWLAALPEGRGVRAVLCVAGWWTVDRPWDTLLPWMEPLPEADLARIRRAAGRIVTLLSDNDPFTSDAEENGRCWQDRLGAEVIRVPGAAHFNRASEPAVLDALLRVM